jgi:DNA end-binding protein Ku
MPRAVWSGSVSFGLVAIPVRLYPATQLKDVRFHLVDRATGRRVRYRRVVETGPDDEDYAAADEPEEPEEPLEPPPGDRRGRTRPEPEVADAPARRPGAAAAREVEVAFDDLARGYEVDDGRFVTLDPEEIERVRPERSRSIDIEDFVELSDIDPVFYDKSYVLAPSNGAAKPYALLLGAMERAGRVGIGRFVLRTKPHLVAIRPREGVLGLETMFFGDEIRTIADVRSGIEGVPASDRELELAERLIETLATDWSPDRYSDTYREELLRLIAEKTPAVRAPEPMTAPSAVEELMDALRQSVEAAKEAKGSGKGRRRAG